MRFHQWWHSFASPLLHLSLARLLLLMEDSPLMVSANLTIAKRCIFQSIDSKFSYIKKAFIWFIRTKSKINIDFAVSVVNFRCCNNQNPCWMSTNKIFYTNELYILYTKFNLLIVVVFQVYNLFICQFNEEMQISKKFF